MKRRSCFCFRGRKTAVWSNGLWKMMMDRRISKTELPRLAGFRVLPAGFKQLKAGKGNMQLTNISESFMDAPELCIHAIESNPMQVLSFLKGTPAATTTKPGG